MTLNKFLDWLDTVRPSPWSHEQKTVWVNDLEAALWSQIFLGDPALWQDRTAAGDGERPLLLAASWRRLYAAYVEAMMDFAAGEFGQYANSMTLYNGWLGELGAWYGEHYDPAGAPPRWTERVSLGHGELTGGAAAVMALPPGEAVLAAEVRITEGFDQGLTLSLGTEEEPERYLAAEDVSAPGRLRALRLSPAGTAGETVYLTLSGESAAGRAEIRLYTQRPAGKALPAPAYAPAAPAPAGRAGKSAYAFAVEAGYTGTEAEFGALLASAAALDDGAVAESTAWSSAKIAADCFVGVDYASGETVAVTPEEGADLNAVTTIPYTGSPVETLVITRSGGENLLPRAKETEITANGVTVTVDEEGVIAFSGTATAGASYLLPLTATAVIPENAYIHLGNSAAFSAVSLQLYGHSMFEVALAPANRIYAYSASPKLANAPVEKIGFWIPAGTTVDGLTVKPQVRRSGDAAGYEPGNAASWLAVPGVPVYGGSFRWSTGLLTLTHGESGPLGEAEVLSLEPQPIYAIGGQNILFSHAGVTTVGGFSPPGPVLENLALRVRALETAPEETVPAVLYAAQSLSDGEKQLARENIGAAPDGAYSGFIDDGSVTTGMTWSSRKIREDCFAELSYDSGPTVTSDPGGGVSLNAVSAIDYTAAGVTTVKLYHSDSENFLPRAVAGEWTNYGITVTVDEEGVITLNGTSTEGYNHPLTTVAPYEIPLNLYMHCGNSAVYSGACLVFPGNGGYTVSFASVNRVYPYTSLSSKLDGQTLTGIALYIPAGLTFENVTVKPQLRRSAAAADYAPCSAFQSYTAALGRTVYGGRLDWAAGRLTLTHGESGPLETEETVSLDARPIYALAGGNALFSDTGDTTVGGYIPAGPVITGLLSRVSGMETRLDGSGDYMPGYWAEHLKERLGPIREKLLAAGGSGGAFLYFTDHHLGSGESAYANAGNTRFLLDYIRAHTPIRRIFHGGDVLNTVSGQTREQALRWLWEFHDEYIAGRGVLSVLGNHECERTAYNTDGDAITAAEARAALFGPAAEETGVSGRAYYHADDAAGKLRYIVLDTESGDFRTDYDQLEWYAGALQSMEEGWTAVLLPHSWFAGAGAEEATVIDRNRRITEMAAACNGRERYGVSDMENGAVVYANGWDFTEAKGTVACLISGHVHFDHAAETDGILCISVTTDCGADLWNAAYDGETRAAGTVAEQAVEVFFVDPAARRVETVRLGYGRDRSWSY